MMTTAPELDEHSPDQPYPTISVVVVNYRAGALLGYCLEAVARQTWRDFEVLLVDNGSDDGSIPALNGFDLRIRLLTPGCNLGFAAANNLAAAQARGDWLAMLNPDAFPEPRWLETLVDATRRHPGFTLFASAQFDHNHPEVLDGAGDPYCSLGFAWRGGKGQPRRLLPSEGRTFGPCAAAALYRKDAFLAAGGFDETFFCYYEDVDLAFRMLLAGHGCLFVPEARVNHLGGALTGAQSPFSIYHITRNRVWTFVKDMPGPLISTLAIPAMLVLLQSLIRRHQRDKARGLMDAFRTLPAVLFHRRSIQRHRRISWMEVAAALTWSPSKILTGTADVRHLPPAQAQGDERVCAVVVTYRPDQHLTANLCALLAQVAHVVVVDNGSDATSLEPMMELAVRSDGQLEVLCNGQNLGLAQAQNRGISLALERGYSWVLLMDDDSLPAEGMVQGLLAAYHETPRRRPIGLLAPCIARDGMHSSQAYTIAQHRWHIARHSFDGAQVLEGLVFAIASGSLIPATVLRQVGLMREDFFIDYVDVDFCLRLREAGYTIVAVGTAHLGHRVGHTEERRLAGRPIAVTHHPSWRRYHIFRNRAYLWRTRWHRWPAWVAFDTAAAVLDLVRILRFEDDSLVKVRGAFRGLWDGIRKRLHETVHGPR